MATDKRSRQRENRAVKKAAADKVARRTLTIRRVRRIVIYGVVIALVLLLANQVWGGDDQALSLVVGV